MTQLCLFRIHLCWLLTALTALAGALRPVAAEPPWSVDDPGVTPHRVLTLYWSYQSSQLRANRMVAFPALAATYGLDPVTELGIGASALTSSGPDLGVPYGMSDLGVGVKRQLIGTADAPRLAVAWQVTMPTGSDAVSSHGFDQSVWTTGQFSHAGSRLTWNIGINKLEHGRIFSSFYGLVLDRQIDPRMVVGAQLYGNSPLNQGDRAELAWGLGGRYALPGNLGLQVMVGRSALGNADRLMFIGMTWDLSIRSRR